MRSETDECGGCGRHFAIAVGDPLVLVGIIDPAAFEGWRLETIMSACSRTCALDIVTINHAIGVPASIVTRGETYQGVAPDA